MTSKKSLLRIKILFMSASLLLLLFSLTGHAYYVEGTGDSVGSFGLVAFLLGWVNMLEAGIAWLANPILLLSWILLFNRRIKASLVLGIVALLFSLSFLLFDEVVANEGGGKREIVGYGRGYWLWVSSCVVNLLGSLVVNIKMKRL